MSQDFLQLRTLDEIRDERPLLFPSAGALQWFVRVNKDELIESGALTRPTGRWLVRPDVFDQVVLSIGARRARRGSASE
jgi:hypothetical protein